MQPAVAKSNSIAPNPASIVVAKSCVADVTIGLGIFKPYHFS